MIVIAAVVSMVTSVVAPPWLDIASVALAQSDSVTPKAVSLGLGLLEHAWFQRGYLLFGVGYGLGFAIQEVQFIRSVRHTNRQVNNAAEYARLVIHLARFGIHLPFGTSYTAAIAMFLPTVWWIGRTLYWVLITVPGGISVQLQAGFTAYLVVLYTGITSIIVVSPVVIGLAVYLETVARGVAALR